MSGGRHDKLRGGQEISRKFICMASRLIGTQRVTNK